MANDLSASTCFISVTYDADTEQLDVVFEDGQRRRYYGIGEHTARRLIEQTPSQGRYYNKKIKGQYDTRKLPDKKP
jgi:hypothetical protein